MISLLTFLSIPRVMEALPLVNYLVQLWDNFVHLLFLS